MEYYVIWINKTSSGKELSKYAEGPFELPGEAEIWADRHLEGFEWCICRRDG